MTSYTSSASKPIEIVLDRLADARRNGTGWTARCPGHDDKNPSLSIREGDDGRALLHCHTGCSVERIVMAMGLAVADLMPDAPARPRGKANRARHRPSPGPAQSPPDLRQWVERLGAQMTDERYGALAASTGIPASAWRALSVGWATADDLRTLRAGGAGWGENYPQGAYAFVERSGNGQAVGLSLRAVDGRKGFPAGMSRGLIVPDLRNRPDPVLIVEGASDVAACLALGLSAVGRPSNRGGTSDLADLLDGRTVLVAGESDQKADGSWPGRDGAKAVAKQLAAKWGEAVRWTLPPDGAKDVRDWLANRIVSGLDVSDPSAMQATGAELLAAIESVARAVEPGEVEQEAVPRPGTPPPDGMDEAAYHGVAGAIVRKIEPHTEADPAALLVQLLVSVGSIIGRGAYIRAGGVKHYANLFAVLVGRTAKGRKGTSAANVNHVMGQVAPDWLDERQQSGLSSGEGLLWAVRDPIEKRIPVKVKGRHTGEYDTVEDDPGVADKRLLVAEGEFAQTLRVMGREGNTLSPIIRTAWDGAHKLQTMTKNSPAKATDAHISIVGHITLDELYPLLAGTAELFNGFANRFLWVYTRRRKLLPDGGRLHEVSFADEVAQLERAVAFGREDHYIAPDADARELWRTIYVELEAEQGGVFGAVTARSSAQTLRLALIYAVLDCDPWIRPAHLHAALAVWRYCEQTAAHIFGGPRPHPTDPYAEPVTWIEARGGRCTVRDLRQRLRRYRDNPQQAEADLQSLVDAGRGRWEWTDPKASGGRQTRRFVLGVYTDNANETPAGATENEPSVGVDTVDTPKTDDEPDTTSDDDDAEIEVEL